MSEHNIDELKAFLNGVLKVFARTERKVGKLESELGEVKEDSEYKIDDLTNQLYAIKSEVVGLESKNAMLQEELDRVKKRSILTEDNANRNGRPRDITDEDIEYIKQARAEGLSLRKIGEMIDKSHTTIARYLKSENGKDKGNVTKEESIEERVKKEVLGENDEYEI